MISFKNVTKIYEDTGEIGIQNINFGMEKGDFLFITGKSGSGKSTIIKLLLRELSTSSGRITVAGKEINLLTQKKIPQYRRRIGVVFQDFSLLQDKNVFQNVAFAQQIMGKSKDDIRRQVTSTLSLLGLANKYHMLPYQISGGEQQKVCLARAIVNQPQIVLADEPTGNLDSESSCEIMSLLDAIHKRGTTVIVATHDMEQVERLGHRNMCLDNRGGLA